MYLMIIYFSGAKVGIILSRAKRNLAYRLLISHPGNRRPPHDVQRAATARAPGRFSETDEGDGYLMREDGFSLAFFINSVGNIPNCFWKHLAK